MLDCCTLSMLVNALAAPGCSCSELGRYGTAQPGKDGSKGEPTRAPRGNELLRRLLQLRTRFCETVLAKGWIAA